MKSLKYSRYRCKKCGWGISKKHFYDSGLCSKCFLEMLKNQKQPKQQPTNKFTSPKGKPFKLRLPNIFKHLQGASLNLIILAVTIISAFLVTPINPVWFVFDWILLIGGIYLLGKVEWKVLKFINHRDLSSDLTFIGLRVLGLIAMGFGIVWIMAAMMQNASLKSIQSALVIHPISFNLFWIFGVLIIFIGLFCLFRTARRYNIVGIWQ